MQELLSAMVEFWWERRGAWRRLGAVRFRTRPQPWPWVAAFLASLPLAWIALEWGWPGEVVGFVGELAVLLGLVWWVLSHESAVGDDGILVQGDFVPWTDVTGACLADGVVEYRARGVAQRVTVTQDFAEALRQCRERARERGS